MATFTRLCSATFGSSNILLSNEDSNETPDVYNMKAQSCAHGPVLQHAGLHFQMWDKERNYAVSYNQHPRCEGCTRDRLQALGTCNITVQHHCRPSRAHANSTFMISCVLVSTFRCSAELNKRIRGLDSQLGFRRLNKSRNK